VNVANAVIDGVANSGLVAAVLNLLAERTDFRILTGRNPEKAALRLSGAARIIRLCYESNGQVGVRYGPDTAGGRRAAPAS
jgi:hypothetical protein